VKNGDFSLRTTDLTT